MQNSSHTRSVFSNWKFNASLVLITLASVCQGYGAPTPSSLSSSAPTNAAEKSDTTRQPNNDHREIFRTRLEQVENAIATFKGQRGSAKPPETLVEEREILRYLMLMFEQADSAAKLQVDLRDEKQRAQQELDRLQDAGPVEQPPYSFLLLDELRGRLTAETARSEALSSEIETSDDFVVEQKRKLSQRERDLRLARDQFGDHPDDQGLSRKVDMLELYVALASATLVSRDNELLNRKTEQAISQTRADFLREKVEYIRKDVSFTEDDLNTKLHHFSETESDLHSELAGIQAELEQAQTRWNAAKANLESSTSRASRLVEEANTWELASTVHRRRMDLVNKQLAELIFIQHIWRQRYHLINGTLSEEENLKWSEEVESLRDRKRSAKQLVDLRLEETRSELIEAQRRLDAAQERSADTAFWIREQIRLHQSLINRYGLVITTLKESESLLDAFHDELADESDSTSLAQWLADVGRSTGEVWNYEIFSIDDRPITVGKVFGGVVLLILGFLASRRISRVVGRRVLPRLGMNEGVANALQTMTFYLLLVCVGFVALELLNVPLTVFAFMGGAVAIGVGFGSQNILNNFISGLIILTERPIRVGDLVEIDGLYGTIEQVGARSTRVKTGSNLEIIVPNSRFLENNVTNWTLSDDQIRAMVSVGVAYGSPTRKVTRLLREAVAKYPEILSEPEPIVLFEEFGDNALLFEVHFWINMRTMMQRRRIESEVRHTIDDLFAEAGITIAYPQRDLHIDSLKPLEVNLRRVSSEETSFPRISDAA